MGPKPKLLLVDDDLAMRELVYEYLQDEFDIVGEAEDGEEALEQVGRYRPELVLMDIEMPRLDGITATSQITEMYPGTVVVILSSKGGADNLKKALAAGARDYVRKPFRPADLAETLRQAASLKAEHSKALAAERPESAGGIWAFCRATGGTGQTTLLLAVANELRAMNREVVVVDAHALFGHVGLYLRLPPGGAGLADLADLDPGEVRAQLPDLLTVHASGLRVLRGCDDIFRGSQLDGSGLAERVAALRGAAEYVLVDLPAGIPDAYAPVLDLARFVFVVTNGSFGAMKGTRDLMEVFLQLGYPAAKLRPVISGFRTDDRVEKEFDGLLRQVDASLDQMFPFDQEAAENAAIYGQPVTRVAPKSPFSVAVRAYVASLIGLEAPAEDPGDGGGSLLSRVFGSLIG